MKFSQIFVYPMLLFREICVLPITISLYLYGRDIRDTTYDWHYCRWVYGLESDVATREWALIAIPSVKALHNSWGPLLLVSNLVDCFQMWLISHRNNDSDSIAVYRFREEVLRGVENKVWLISELMAAMEPMVHFWR